MSSDLFLFMHLKNRFILRYIKLEAHKKGDDQMTAENPEIAYKIKQFFDLDQQVKRMTKQTDPLKVDIKDYFRTKTEKSMQIGDIVAEFKIQERCTTNAEKLVEKLKKLKRKDLIKKIEVPDMQTIEKLIYDQELDASLLADCIETKEVEVLTVKKAKPKKSEEEE